jgi:hypothetical protein
MFQVHHQIPTDGVGQLFGFREFGTCCCGIAFLLLPKFPVHALLLMSGFDDLKIAIAVPLTYHIDFNDNISKVNIRKEPKVPKEGEGAFHPIQKPCTNRLFV